MSNTKSPDSAASSDAGEPDEASKIESDGNDEVVSVVQDEASTIESDGDVDVAAVEEDVAPGRRFWLVSIVAAVVLVIDQITKVWAASALVDRDIDLFWTARFNLTRNFGSAFGLGASLGRWLALIIVVVVIAMLLFARTITDRRMLALFGAITGGAVGNLLDRLLRAEDGFMSGGVIDFIDFQWWPIFNVADIAVVCGAAGLMLLNLREPA